MQVTAWNNGGTGYGLQVQISDRERFFDHRWQNVIVELPGEKPTVVTLSPSFWRRCTELRSVEIGRWLQRNGLAPWPYGQRPKMTMENIAGNRFAVKLPS